MAVSSVVVVNKPTTASGEVVNVKNIIEVVSNNLILSESGNGSAVEVVKPGGTVVGISVSETPPLNPAEGQIWIDIS